jgi:hypothetical protein
MSQVTEVVHIPPAQHRHIVGPQRSILRAIERSTGCSISVPPIGSSESAVRVTGPSRGVADAIADIIARTSGVAAPKPHGRPRAGTSQAAPIYGPAAPVMEVLTFKIVKDAHPQLQGPSGAWLRDLRRRLVDAQRGQFPAREPVAEVLVPDALAHDDVVKLRVPSDAAAGAGVIFHDFLKSRDLLRFLVKDGTTGAEPSAPNPVVGASTRAANTPSPSPAADTTQPRALRWFPAFVNFEGEYPHPVLPSRA